MENMDFVYFNPIMWIKAYIIAVCTGKEPEVERDIKKLEKRKDLPDTR